MKRSTALYCIALYSQFITHTMLNFQVRYGIRTYGLGSSCPRLLFRGLYNGYAGASSLAGELGVIHPSGVILMISSISTSISSSLYLCVNLITLCLSLTLTHSMCVSLSVPLTHSMCLSLFHTLCLSLSFSHSYSFISHYFHSLPLTFCTSLILSPLIYPVGWVCGYSLFPSGMRWISRCSPQSQ